MEQNNYHSRITANVTPAQAFAGIANVNEWWAKNFEGRALQNGDTFTVRFGDTKVDFEITGAIPDEKIIWNVKDSYLPWLKNKTEWNNTSVVWAIAEEGDSTVIDMTHIGLVPGVECYEACDAGWTKHIAGSLQKLLTEGAGQPQ